MRLYLKTPGVFYGYTVSYTADGKLSIVFKDAPDKLSDAIVALDAGHGGKDCGTIGVNGIYESEVNLNITILVKENLEKAGVNVILTRSDNTFLSVDKRQSMARYSGADLFVSDITIFPRVHRLFRVPKCIITEQILNCLHVLF